MALTKSPVLFERPNIEAGNVCVQLGGLQCTILIATDEKNWDHDKESFLKMLIEMHGRGYRQAQKDIREALGV
jgi:hypothetical protein